MEEEEKSEEPIFKKELGEGDIPGVSEAVGALPFSPPDPLGAILWHAENEGDLLLKGDGILERLGKEGIFK